MSVGQRSLPLVPPCARICVFDRANSSDVGVQYLVLIPLVSRLGVFYPFELFILTNDKKSFNQIRASMSVIPLVLGPLKGMCKSTPWYADALLDLCHTC
jgi:hypothetical protein